MAKAANGRISNAEKVVDDRLSAAEKVLRITGDIAKVFELVEDMSYVSGNGVEFEFLTRSIRDFGLGKTTGDCTGPGKGEYRVVSNQLAHLGMQIMKVFVDGKLLGKIHVILCYVNHKPSLVIEGTEFAPYTDDGPSSEINEKMRKMRLDAFNTAITKIRETADRMGVGNIYAVDISNRDWVKHEYRKLNVRKVLLSVMGGISPIERFVRKSTKLEEPKIDSAF